MESLTLLLFCGVLIGCIVAGAPILYALVAGFLIFCAYAKARKNTWGQITAMILSGIKTARNILTLFILIGMLTALWRACGTIPAIIYYAVRLMHPGTFMLMAFLLNCGVSLLTGTAFGTAATMGMICMTMAGAMQMSPVMVGGAVLSGVFFGDRCSPVSSSALLVSSLTATDIFENIKRMFRTAAVPFVLTGGVYLAAGMLSGGGGESPDPNALFGDAFVLHPACLLPAAAILVLSALRVNVKITMAASIGLAAVVAVLVQQVAPADLPRILLGGYHAADPAVGALIDGGGIRSMLNVAAIVCISSAYAGIFRGTELLGGIRTRIVWLSDRITPYGGTLCTSVVAAMIACNQTLTVMLTHQLCDGLHGDAQALAIDLEDTAVVVAPLVPWSIAGAVPLASAGAPMLSLFVACFLYLLPAWRLIRALPGRRRAIS